MINWLQGHNQHTNFKAMVNHDGVFGRSNPRNSCPSVSFQCSFVMQMSKPCTTRPSRYISPRGKQIVLPHLQLWVLLLIIGAISQGRGRYDALGRPSTI